MVRVASTLLNGGRPRGMSYDAEQPVRRVRSFKKESSSGSRGDNRGRLNTDAGSTRGVSGFKRKVASLIIFLVVAQVAVFLLYRLRPLAADSDLKLNTVTGVWEVPEPQKIIMVEPHSPLPIESEMYKSRIEAIKEGRSHGPRGVAPERIGRAYCATRKDRRRCAREYVGEPVLFHIASTADAVSMLSLVTAFSTNDAYEVLVVLHVRDWEGVDKSVASAWKKHLSEGGSIPEPAVGSGGWEKMLESYAPVAVFGVRNSENALVNRDIELASESLDRATAAIFMPAEDFPHAEWISTLAPIALASWHIPSLSVSIVTNDRPWSLRRLLESLRAARLFGCQLPVSISIDVSADDDTLTLVQDFAGQWAPRGLVHTSLRTLQGGLIRAVTESFYPRDRHHHCVILEDDIEVSPLFFAWSLYTTLSYLYGEADNYTPDLYGVSLFTPRKSEIHPRVAAYDSNLLIAEHAEGHLHMPYLHQLPCSWGALYFSESWKEFRAYLAARLHEDHIVVHIAAARTSWWRVSWKRYFIEMAYQRQYYMLYPNYHNQTSFATNWMEPGAHIAAVTGGKKKKGGGDNKHHPQHFTVPLMTLEQTHDLLEQLPNGQLPPLHELPRLDVLDQFLDSSGDMWVAGLGAVHRSLLWLYEGSPKLEHTP